jgi:hypothetical protein
MKFKIGDKVMLKAVPYGNFGSGEEAINFFHRFKNNVFDVTSVFSDKTLILKGHHWIYKKYLKHAVKPKPVMYRIDCIGMACGRDCSPNINGDIKICEFTGTKSQVEAHIKRYWKQPKIKAVVK